MQRGPTVRATGRAQGTKSNSDADILPAVEHQRDQEGPRCHDALGMPESKNTEQPCVDETSCK